MHKHRKRRNAANSERRNSNLRLSSACRSKVRTLVSRISGESIAHTYLSDTYLSKFTGESGGVTNEERRVAAIQKWKAVERRNLITNDRIRGLSRQYNILPRVTFDRFLQVAQHQISEILGPLSDELAFGDFSGGASTSRRRTSSHPTMKYNEQADVTEDTLRYVPAITGASHVYREHRFLSDLTVVPGAVLFTVPKSTTIDRCACKEPDVNMYLQKAVGSHIRSRLKRFGIDLNDQSINRELAQLGSARGDLATLDLSSASDTICRQAVRALLPCDWFEYLDDIRSQFVSVDGTFVRTEMFSSMGNGFTFELESLIFYVLMRATAYLRGHRGTISVYGDDLIIPSGMYDDATWILQEFGFSCNMEKSFADGPFRESCGGHFFLGHDISPFYLKKEPTHLTDLIRVLNQLRKWASRDDGLQYVHENLFLLWEELAQFVPREFWGGVDCDVDTQLVSSGPPRQKLVRVETEKPLPESGCYMQWSTLTRNRSSPPVLGTAAFTTLTSTGHVSSDMPDTKFCRARRAKPSAFTSRPWLFIEELGAVRTP